MIYSKLMNLVAATTMLFGFVGAVASSNPGKLLVSCEEDLLTIHHVLFFLERDELVKFGSSD